MGSLAAAFPLPSSFGCSSALSITPHCQLSARWLSTARCRGLGRRSQPSPRGAEDTGTSRLAQGCGGEQQGEGGRLGLTGAAARFTRYLASIRVHRSKRQSSAQHRPRLTEAAGSPGTASMRWPGDRPALQSCPPSWPSLDFASRSGLEPCFAQCVGSSQLLLILTIRPLAPKPRRAARTVPKPLQERGDSEGPRQKGSWPGLRGEAVAEVEEKSPGPPTWPHFVLLPLGMATGQGRSLVQKLPLGMCRPALLSSCLPSRPRVPVLRTCA